MEKTESTNWGELKKQATQTTYEYMEAGKEQIDIMFGRGYSEQNPQLLIAYMKSATQNLQTSFMESLIQQSTARIAGALNQIAGSMPGPAQMNSTKF